MEMRTMSRRSMAITLTLGILAIAHVQPALAGASSGALRGSSTVVRNVPTVPTAPRQTKGGSPGDGHQTRNFGSYGLDGTWYGVARTLLFVISH
jgi:hypothetical protein